MNLPWFHKSPAENRSVGKEMREILIVDDQGEIRAVMREILERLGWTVRDVESGAAALALAKEGKDRLGLALVDVMLPDIDGMEVARELRRIRPNLAIVMLSGFLNEESRWIVREQDLRFLAKPFTATELRDLVVDVLGDLPPAKRP